LKFLMGGTNRKKKRMVVLKVGKNPKQKTSEKKKTTQKKKAKNPKEDKSKD
jgi:hypothetical protein